MRGAKVETQGLFSYLSPEQRVPQDHPLRAIRAIVDRALAEMDSHFGVVFATYGRPSIPPEFLLRALLLQVFYSIRSERQLVEQLNYNLLFRWFVGLGMVDAVWVPTVFSKNRDRLLDQGSVREFLHFALEPTRRQDLRSDATVQLVDDLGGTQHITLGADKGYDRHAGYAMSIHVRRRIESIFGWMKTVGGMRKTRFRGLDRVGMHFSSAATAYNLVRVARLGVI
ncbi:transposase [Candidatus Igneacidithiobacillus taiwanensis]|uniref:transposase n=1 Tax=Candidatus Igneacidithiobacillus taiwanensis TaxID=1945924 RepID=UPI0028967ED7|nr:transposase [Candidatus Igneacidithiobacillus taiwanensis]MCE5360750.1 transposase [Acidithiobacillus sp.]